MNGYTDFIPSRQAAAGVPDPIAPPENNAQMTLWDYIALAAVGTLLVGVLVVGLVLLFRPKPEAPPTAPAPQDSGSKWKRV